MLKSKSLKLTLCAGAALASLSVLSTSAFAGEDSKTTKEIQTTEQPKSAITGDLGVNFVSQYISRGLVLENQGVIAQPYADLYFSLYEGTGFINKVSLNLGIWSSLHSREVPGSTTAAWYEFDWTPGIAVTFAKNFTLTSSYFEFDSPNDSFKTARSANFRLDFNDADYLKAFALHPHVTYLRELEGKAGSGTHQGNYYEVGVAPGLPAYGPLTVTFPVTAGFGSSRFYQHNQGVGYISAGANAAVALSFIPASYGTWTFNAGVTYYYLVGALSYATSVQPNDHNDWVFNGGVGMTF